MQIKRLIVGDIEANCYILKSGNDIVVIDPGDDSDIIIDNIKKSRAKLKYIINTHYHEDHVSGNDEIQKICGGDILIHEDEKKFVDFKVDRYIDENENINFGDVDLKIIHTPGHSPGSICLLYEKTIFTGDTLFLNGCGRFDLLGGSEKDLEESLLKLSNIIKSGMVVYSGHGDSYVVES